MMYLGLCSPLPHAHSHVGPGWGCGERRGLIPPDSWETYMVLISSTNEITKTRLVIWHLVLGPAFGKVLSKSSILPHVKNNLERTFQKMRKAQRLMRYHNLLFAFVVLQSFRWGFTDIRILLEVSGCLSRSNCTYLCLVSNWLLSHEVSLRCNNKKGAL